MSLRINFTEPVKNERIIHRLRKKLYEGENIANIFRNKKNKININEILEII